MTVPTLRFELSLPDPGQDRSWIDETAFIRRWSTNRGRDNELDRARAGQATLIVDDRDGRYVSSNTLSPHYPFMRPARSVRLTADLPTGLSGFSVGSSFVGSVDLIGAGSTVTFYLFTGFLEDFPLTWDPSNTDSVATLQAIDGFMAFAQAQFDLTFPLSPFSVVSGERIHQVLETVGWQGSELDPDLEKVENGTVIILGTFGGNDIEVHEKALEHIQKVAETEGGNIFVDAVGDVVFYAADHVADLDPTEVFGSGAGEIHYTDIAISSGVERIANDIEVSVSPANVGAATATSVTSIARHWRRSLSLSLLAATVVDSAEDITTKRARELRDRYATPRLRITELKFKPTTVADWMTILGKEIGDVILVRKVLPQGDTIEQVSLIEGIAYDSPDIKDWTVTWTLSAHVTEPVSLLTENQQSIETDTTGWVADTGCVISRVQEFDGKPLTLDGTAALLVETSADPAEFKTDPASGIPVSVGVSYRGVAGMIGEFTGGIAHLEIDWLTAAEAFISTSTGATVQIRNSSWRFIEVEGTAPGTAAFAVLRGVISFDHNVDVAFDLFDFYEV